MNIRSKKHKNKFFHIAFMLVLAILVFLLFPRVTCQLDGGSAQYFSFGGGLIYYIDRRHSFYEEGGNIYYQVGSIIYIFGHEVFNNVHVDYSHLSVETHSSEYYEIREEVNSILFSTK